MSFPKQVADPLAFVNGVLIFGAIAEVAGCARPPVPNAEKKDAVAAAAPAEEAGVKRDPTLSKFAVRLMAFHEELVSVTPPDSLSRSGAV